MSCFHLQSQPSCFPVQLLYLKHKYNSKWWQACGQAQTKPAVGDWATITMWDGGVPLKGETRLSWYHSTKPLYSCHQPLVMP